MSKHLWEVKHAYYCNEGNFYAPGGNLLGLALTLAGIPLWIAVCHWWPA